MKISLKLADLSKPNKNKHQMWIDEMVKSSIKFAQAFVPQHYEGIVHAQNQKLRCKNLLMEFYSPSIAKILLIAIEKHRCHEWIMERILTGMYSADDILKMAMGKKQASQWAEKLKVQYSVDTKGIQKCLENLKS